MKTFLFCLSLIFTTFHSQAVPIDSAPAEKPRAEGFLQEIRERQERERARRAKTRPPANGQITVTTPDGGTVAGDVSKDPKCKLSLAANLAMATVNKSCEAAKTTRSGGKDACGIKESRAPGKVGSGQYVFGAGHGDGGDSCDFKNGNTADCSSFVSKALCRAGMSPTPDGKSGVWATGIMMKWGPPCFETPADGFDVGDIIVKQGDPGHVVIICGSSSSQPTSDLSQLEVCEASGKATGIVKRSLESTVQGSPKIAKAVARQSGSKILRHSKTACMGKPKPFTNEDKCANVIPAFE